jgi:drug/metabolite transporter (DMT)-like permease
MKTELYGTLMALVTTIFTGLNLTLARIGIQAIPSFVFAAICFTNAGAILTTINLLRGKSSEMVSLIGEFPIKIIWIAIVGTSLPFLLIFYAFSLSSLTNSFLLQTEVLYTILLGYVILGEKVTFRQTLLTVVAVIGVVMILTNGSFASPGLGDFLLIVAPIAFPAAHVIAKPILIRSDALIVSNIKILIGGCALLASCAVIAPSQLSYLTVSTNLPLIVAESIAVMMSNSLFYVSMKWINLSKATAINQAFPVVSVPLGILLLGETLTPITLIGGTMLMLSVIYISNLRSELRS